MSTDVLTENGYLKIANELYDVFCSLHILSAFLNQLIINGWKGFYIQMDSQKAVEILDKMDFSVDRSNRTLINQILNNQNKMSENMDKMLSRIDKNKRK